MVKEDDMTAKKNQHDLPDAAFLITPNYIDVVLTVIKAE